MVKLILYEYRKHFCKSSIIAAIFLFSIFNVIKINSIYEENSLLSKNNSPLWKSLYQVMYQEFGGNITKDKIEKLLSISRPLEKQIAEQTANKAMDNPNTYTGNIYQDTLFFRWCFVNPMKYDFQYKSYANDVVTLANENMTFFNTLGNIYEYRKNKYIANLFHGRTISNFYYTEMYQYYLHYDFSSLLMLLICLYGLVGVFVSEKETEMDTLLLTTKSGGSRSVLAKILSSFLFVSGICMWFLLLDFASFSFVFDSLSAASAPLYAIQNFSDTSINITLFQYAVLSGLIKTAGMLVLAMVFLLLSCLFKNALLPFIIGLSIAFGLIYFQIVYSNSDHVILKAINPFSLIINRDLFRKTQFTNVCGVPIINYVVSLFFSTVWSGLLLTGIAFFIRKNSIFKGR